MTHSEPHASGVLTFLFTDLENSTPLWEQAPERMQMVSARHDELLRRAFEAHRGRVVKTTGTVSPWSSSRLRTGLRPRCSGSRPGHAAG
jgi:hypothetical protein